MERLPVDCNCDLGFVEKNAEAIYFNELSGNQLDVSFRTRSPTQINEWPLFALSGTRIVSLVVNLYSRVAMAFVRMMWGNMTHWIESRWQIREG